MNKETKIVLGGAGILGLGYWLWNLYKSSKKEVREEIKKEVETLKEAGINPNINTEEIKKDDKPFVEKVLRTLMFNMNEDIWNDSVLKTTDYETHDQTLWGSLRVMQRDDETVSVFIHIPPYFGGKSKSGFKTLKQYKELILETLNSFLSDTGIRGFKWQYKGYYEKISENLTKDGQNKVISEEIPEEDCMNFSEHGSYTDGLARLISYYYENNAERLENDKELVGVCAFIELSFPLAKNENDKFGMDIIKMVKLLKTLTFDLNIMERDIYDPGDVFPSIIFFPGKNTFDAYYSTIEVDGTVNGYESCTLTCSLD